MVYKMVEGASEPIYLNRISYYSEFIHLGDLLSEIADLKREEKTNLFDNILRAEKFQDIIDFITYNKIPSDIFFKLKDIFIRNIIFHTVSHVYVKKISSTVSLSSIEKRIAEGVNLLTSNFSGMAKQSIKNDYYNLIDEVTISESDLMYYPAFYKKDDSLILFSSVRLNNRSGKAIIVPGMVKIDLENRMIYSFLCNKFAGGRSKDSLLWSIGEYQEILMMKLKTVFNISCYEISNEEERLYKKNMFKSCQRMNRKLIEDYENKILNDMPTIDTHVKHLLSNLNCIVSLSKTDKEKIRKKIISLCVGEYMTKEVKPLELKKKALSKGLKGYPTRIKFSGMDASSSNTKSRGKDHPLPIHEIFHSLNASFEYFGSITEWRIAWFNRYLFANTRSFGNSSSVSQATIKVSSSSIIINLLPRENKNEEMVRYIVNEVQSDVKII